MRFITALLINGILVYTAAFLLTGVSVDGYLTAIIVALLLALVNTFIRPILTLISFPLTILTLGLFLIIINGLMVLLVSNIVSGFFVNGLLSAAIFSIILGFFNLLLGNNEVV